MVLLQDREKQRRKAPPSVLVKTFQPSERASEFETLEVRVSGPFSSHMLTRGQRRPISSCSTSASQSLESSFVKYPRVSLLPNHHESHHILLSVDRFGSFKRPVLSGPDELLRKQDGRYGGKIHFACLTAFSIISVFLLVFSHFTETSTFLDIHQN